MVEFNDVTNSANIRRMLGWSFLEFLEITYMLNLKMEDISIMCVKIIDRGNVWTPMELSEISKKNNVVRSSALSLCWIMRNKGFKRSILKKVVLKSRNWHYLTEIKKTYPKIFQEFLKLLLRKKWRKQRVLILFVKKTLLTDRDINIRVRIT